MRHILGTTLLVGSLIAGISFYMAGELIVEEKPAVIVAAGPTWNVASAEITLNWLVAAPIGICFAAGVACLLVQGKKTN